MLMRLIIEKTVRNLWFKKDTPRMSISPHGLFSRAFLVVSFAAATFPANAAEDPAFEAGRPLYAERCESCHGTRGQERAMGRSKPIARLTSEEISAKLRKHQNAAVGSAMKDKMKSGLSSNNIRVLSDYIATFGR